MLMRREEASVDVGHGLEPTPRRGSNEPPCPPTCQPATCRPRWTDNPALESHRRDPWGTAVVVQKGWPEALRVEKLPSQPGGTLLSREEDWAWHEADRSSGSTTCLGIEERPPETMKRAHSQNQRGLVELPVKPPQPEGTVREHPPPSA
ncbi:hypothetical protein E2C01_065326 [Portunus trituberculatus]|uniref:Uncharacterized protein n=1 Tax=Portunus trituberculatus TaxID=210409 RepID=A0A5B7HQS3_PORTR|nr:hypothetical protein [Portunus trituberculatus]